jgi:hypothetical protein
MHTHMHTLIHTHNTQVHDELDEIRPEKAGKLMFDALSNKWSKSVVNLRVHKTTFAYGRTNDCILVKDDGDVFSGDVYGPAGLCVMKKMHVGHEAA